MLPLSQQTNLSSNFAVEAFVGSCRSPWTASSGNFQPDEARNSLRATKGRSRWTSVPDFRCLDVSSSHSEPGRHDAGDADGDATVVDGCYPFR